MAAQTFKVGDIVILKSGSPTMTIVHPDKNPAGGYEGQTVWTCVWFETRGKPHYQSFPEVALDAASERDTF